jgi:hypothetical protein
METRVYNIDSKFRNLTAYPSSSNFVFNRVEQNDGTTYIDNNIIKNNFSIEPFNEKNVVEMTISSIEITNTIYYLLNSRNNNTLLLGSTTISLPEGSYTKQELADLINTSLLLSSIACTYSSTTGKITIINNNPDDISFPLSGTVYYSLGSILGYESTVVITTGSTVTGTNVMKTPKEAYFFMRINDFGTIVNKNRRYFSKLSIDPCCSGTTNEITLIGNKLKFDQPTDIPQLKISLEDEFGNLIDLNGNDFSFTLEIVVITNTILKNYNEIRFYNEDAMDRILKARMLAYYEKNVDSSVNNSLTNTYNSNLISLNNQQEYNTFGSSNNYAPSFSYFREMNGRS